MFEQNFKMELQTKNLKKWVSPVLLSLNNSSTEIGSVSTSAEGNITAGSGRVGSFVS